jgi:hypothetical protein
MAAPSRFTSGVSTANKGSALWSYPYPDNTKVYTYFNDFDVDFIATDWTETKIGAGGAIAGPLADEPFGAVVLTSDALDNDGIQEQMDAELFTLSATKKFWFKTRLKWSKVTQSDILVGLAVLDTTLLGSVDGDGVTDGVFFSKEDGDALLDFNVQKNTSTGQSRATSLATLVADTYTTLGFYYDGAGEVTAYVDDVKKASIAMSTTNMPDTALAVSFAYLNGEAGAATTTIDYVLAAIER